MTIQNHGVNVNLFAEHALISEGWAQNVRISVGEDGRHVRHDQIEKQCRKIISELY